MTTPLPYNLLFNGPLPGLTENLRQFDNMAFHWSRQSIDRQIQVLDDAIGPLRAAYGPDSIHPLIPRLERAIGGLMEGRGLAGDHRILGDLRAALRGLPAEDRGAVRADPSLERFRIITRPIGPGTSSQMAIRGPAHLLRPHRPGGDLLDEFGKSVLSAWGPDVEAARSAFQASACTESHQGAMEIQSFSTSREDRDRKVKALADSGFDVRHAPIPWYLTRGGPFPGDLEHLRGRRIVHWIVARRGEMPLEKWFSRFLDGSEAKGEHPIGQLDLLERSGVSPEDPGFDESLHELFGRPLAWKDIRRGFATDVPGYVTRRVSLQRHEGSLGVSLQTEITTRKGELAARLNGWLPPPVAGEPWIAWGEDLNEHLYGSIAPDRVLKHLSQGIGRRSLVRILAFLHRLGVNALDMMGRGHGLTFMPYIGFDFQDEDTRERVVADFVQYVSEHDANLSEKTRAALLHVRRAWDVVDFENDRGEPLGRDFLIHYARERKASVPLRFWLTNSYPGWRRLFSKQLAMHPELDPETSRKGVDAQLVNRAMMERAKAVVQSTRRIDLDLPVEVRRRESEKDDLILHLLQENERLKSNAERDSLTGLLNRRAFLVHNQELEKSLSANRQSDGPNEHWVLMLDIDHFKKVNDTYGHGAGDEVIRRIAEILKDCVREEDLVCRWGGEEFAVVLKHTDREGARIVAERIREEVMKRPLRVNGGNPHPLSVSIGAAPFRVVTARRKSSGEFNPHAEDPTQVINSLTVSLDDADGRLYEAKQNGRNRVVYKDAEMSFG